MSAQPRTRKPTGKVAYPLLLVEGEEKAGKTYASLALSASERIGRTFVLELDEPTADEYAVLGPFEILEHDGTFTSLIGQLEAATAVPAEAGKPNLIVLDSGTALWDLVKTWTEHRARSSRKAKQKLAEDPDAEIDVSMNLWNDAKDRWYRMLNLLRLWPGIGIIVARGREVAKVENGQPVAGQTEWRVDAEKSTGFAVSAWVRMTRPHTATLVAARSLHVDVPAKGLVLPAERPLEHLVFDVLGAGGEFQPSALIVPQPVEPLASSEIHEWIREALRGMTDAEREQFKVWRQEQRLPTFGDRDRLTDPQAELVIDWIDALRAEAASVGGSPGLPTDDLANGEPFE